MSMKKYIAAAAVLVIAGTLIGINLFGKKQDKQNDPDYNQSKIINNGDAKTVLFEGGNYAVEFKYDKQFCVSSYKAKTQKEGGEQMSADLLAQDGGISLFATAYMDDGSEFLSDSLALEADPEVEISGNAVTFRFETGPVSYEVVAILENHQMTLDLKRSYAEDFNLGLQGFPSIHLEENAAENVRWLRSGSNFWVGGKGGELHSFLSASRFYEKNWITESMEEAPTIVRGMEDITFALLSQEVAVSFEGEVFDRANERPYLTEIQRYDCKTGIHLVMDVSISSLSKPLRYSTGTADGWGIAGMLGGRTGAQGTRLLRDYGVNAGQTDRIRFIVTSRDCDFYLDMGELKGIDEKLLSEALNNYGRLMIMDWNMGTNATSSTHMAMIPAFEQHWTANIVGILRDDGALASQMNGLRMIRDNLQHPDGHIGSAYMGFGFIDDIGEFASDVNTAYVTSICIMHELTGDQGFLEEMVESAERALEYMWNKFVDQEKCVVKNINDWDFTSKFNIPYNDYWEHCGGKYNGYATAMYYDALSRLAVLERNVLGNAAKADSYEELAAKVKESYNEVFWSEKTETYLYGTGTNDICYLPVQGAALKTDIAEDRAKKIVSAVEREHAVFDMPFHVMNIRDILSPDRSAPQTQDYSQSMNGENGGWYGAPDGDFYAGFPAYGDRTLIPRYINGYTRAFAETGLIGSTYMRDGATRLDQGWTTCMPTFANVIWGLYTYGYGFQPSYDSLAIAPFIDESMKGSVVKYRWRSTDMSVTYHGLYDFSVDIFALPTNIFVNFINQTPYKTYAVRVDGTERAVAADANGIVTVQLEKAGSTRTELVDPDKENAKEDSVNLALGKPAAVSSVRDFMAMTYWPIHVTDSAEFGDNFWQPDKNDSQPWMRLDLGRPYAVENLILIMNAADTYYYTVEGTSDPTFQKWDTLADRSASGAKTDSEGRIEEKIAGEYAYIRIHFNLAKGEAGQLAIKKAEVY